MHVQSTVRNKSLQTSVVVLGLGLVSQVLGLEGQVLGLGLESQVLGLGLEGQVLGLEGQVLGLEGQVLGLEGQVLVNNTATNASIYLPCRRVASYIHVSLLTSN